MADLNLKAGTNMSIRQEDTDLYLDNNYEYDDTEIQQNLLTRSLITETGNIIELTLNNTNYKLVAILKNKYGNVISTSNEIDLPIESLVVSIYYDSTTKELVFVLKDGTTTRVPLLDLIDGLATQEDLETLEESVNNNIQTFKDDINEDMTTFKGDVEQELEKTQQELDMYKMIENALPKVTSEETTEPITLDNTAKAKMKLSFKGQTHQDSTTGKNLAEFGTRKDTNKYTYNSYLENNVDVTKIATGGSFYASYILHIPSAGSYKFKGNVLYGPQQFYIYTDELYGNLIKTGSFTQDEIIYSWDVEEAGDYILGLSGSEVRSYGVKDFMFISSSVTDDTYEPYTGENPAPNPEYPMDIHTVSGDNTIKVQNKNLANVSIFGQVPSLSNGQLVNLGGSACTDYINIDNSKEYVFSFTTNITAIPYIAFYDDNHSFLGYNQINSSGYVLSSSNYYSSCKYIRLRFDQYERYITIQLEKGTTPTDYIKHQEQSQLISLGDIEYCEIGDYKDKFFKNTIDSEEYVSTLELDKWYLKKRIGKKTLTGASDENWYIEHPTDVPNNFYLTINDAIGNPRITIINSIGKHKISLAENYATYISSGKYLNFRCDEITSVVDFKAMLSNKNMIVYYALATPEYIPLNDTLQDQYDNLQRLLSYDGQTNISQENNDLPFKMIASALRDLSNIE